MMTKHRGGGEEAREWEAGEGMSATEIWIRSPLLPSSFFGSSSNSFDLLRKLLQRKTRLNVSASCQASLGGTPSAGGKDPTYGKQEPSVNRCLQQMFLLGYLPLQFWNRPGVWGELIGGEMVQKDSVLVESGWERPEHSSAVVLNRELVCGMHFLTE